MSLSKVAQKCEICKKGTAIYSCPRCNCKYCSSQCYKDRKHELCSESFYREWVESTLHERSFDEDEKANMMHILKKCNDEFSDDISDEEPSLGDRLAGLNINDEDVLWQNLTKEEKAEFTELIEDDKNLESIILLKQPWWTVTTLDLVTDMENNKLEEDAISPRPYYPLNVKKLSSITSKKPSICLQYNLINILYAYAFLVRFYNCDLRDFLEEVARYLFALCPVLSEGKNYQSLEESIQDSIRLIINSELNVPVDFAKSIVNDISNIMQGPVNAKPATFVLCALHDVELLLLETKSLLKNEKSVDKSFRKALMPAVKKIEFFMSWSLEFEGNLSEFASDLMVLMLPELLVEPEVVKSDENIHDVVKKKPLIEEIN